MDKRLPSEIPFLLKNFCDRNYPNDVGFKDCKIGFGMMTDNLYVGYFYSDVNRIIIYSETTEGVLLLEEHHSIY